MRSPILSMALLGLSLVGFGAPAASSQTITEIVLQSGTPGEFDANAEDFDILLQAVVTAGLDDDLDTQGANLTVFAPTDAAFIRLAKDLGYAGRDEAGTWSFLVTALDGLSGGDPVGLLTSILQYHVVPERLTAFQVMKLSMFGQTIATLLPGAEFRPRFFVLIDNEPDLADAGLMFPLNIAADNGIIHTINRVLIPIDIP